MTQDISSKQSILIVDDVPENIDVLAGILKGCYNIKAATNGEICLNIAGSQPQPDLILLDVMMPVMTGFEVCRRLKENPLTSRIPVIFVTTLGEVFNESAGFAVGGVDYITKPVSLPIVLARVKTHLAIYDQNRALEERVQERTKELNETRLEIIRCLGHAAEFKDNETGMHIIRMSKYSQIIALDAGLPEDEADLILNAAPMHDIGKIGIPDGILQKPGKLDKEEWEIMQTHCGIGYKIIGEHTSKLLISAALAALAHHEKWDGTGYPGGIAGKDIPVIGRIVAIADVFDALTSERPYKKAWPVDQALDLIKKESGRHFDPDLASGFMRQITEILKVKVQHSG